MTRATCTENVLQGGVQLATSHKFCNQSAQGTLHTCLDMLHKMKHDLGVKSDTEIPAEKLKEHRGTGN